MSLANDLLLASRGQLAYWTVLMAAKAAFVWSLFRHCEVLQCQLAWFGGAEATRRPAKPSIESYTQSIHTFRWWIN